MDGSSNPNRQYTWGNRYVDDLVLRTRDTDANGTLDETLYALHDANWSITALTDTSGTVMERFRYDPYGRPAVLDASFAGDADGFSDYNWEYRFTSREWDAESGLHYFRARFYDDAGGRFLQRDSIGYADGMNLYAGYFLPDRLDPTGFAIGPRLPRPPGPVTGTVSYSCEVPMVMYCWGVCTCFSPLSVLNTVFYSVLMTTLTVACCLESCGCAVILRPWQPTLMESCMELALTAAGHPFTDCSCT